MKKFESSDINSIEISDEISITENVENRKGKKKLKPLTNISVLCPNFVETHSECIDCSSTKKMEYARSYRMFFDEDFHPSKCKDKFSHKFNPILINK